MMWFPAAVASTALRGVRSPAALPALMASKILPRAVATVGFRMHVCVWVCVAVCVCVISRGLISATASPALMASQLLLSTCICMNTDKIRPENTSLQFVPYTKRNTPCIIHRTDMTYPYIIHHTPYTRVQRAPTCLPACFFGHGSLGEINSLKGFQESSVGQCQVLQRLIVSSHWGQGRSRLATCLCLCLCQYACMDGWMDGWINEWMIAYNWMIDWMDM